MRLKLVPAKQCRYAWPQFGCLLAVFVILLPSWVSADEYASMARLLVGGSAVDPKLDDGQSIPDSFYVTQMEVIESAMLTKRAEMRVKGTHPEWKVLWKDTDVDIRTARTPNSRIINVLSTSKEPEFARLFLDSLMNEFIAWRQSLRDEEFARKQQALKKQMLEVQNALDTMNAQIKVTGDVADNRVKNEYERLSKRLEMLLDKAEALNLEFKSEGDVISIMEQACPPVKR
jgi:uncharacterized protein involved in exopolysaccharide biosynthesis